MSHILKELEEKKLVSPPSWVTSNTMYLCTMGSIAYGVAQDSSDYDVYGWFIGPKEEIFPHLAGYVYGFDEEPKITDYWQQHHVFDQSALAGNGREYDFSLFSIVKYFKLLSDGNPNILDSLFVNQECILHSTKVANMLREKRKIFLAKHIWGRYKGYAYSQLHKASSKNPKEGSKRKKLKDAHGFDVKFMYHVVRLLSECEQILMQGDLDLQEKGRREHMKAIRRGEVAEADIRRWAANKEKQLEKLYIDSSLPSKPKKEEIKQLLLHCLEEHYGDLSSAVTKVGWAEQALKDINHVLERHRKNL